MSSTVVGYNQTLGDDTVPISYENIELADCFLIAGANPAWCHPILFRRLEKHKTDNPDTKIIVIDPHQTDSASLADLHLQIQPSTDQVLFHAISKYLIDNGLTDEEYIRNHVNGYDELKKQLKRRYY